MSSGGYCTSGIPMRAGSGTSYRYLLTAAHCARWVNDVAFRTGANVELGINRWTGVLLETNSLDATLIRLPDLTGLRGHVYTGAWNGTTTTAYHGISPWAKTITACLTGATSGSRCTLKRAGDDTSRRDVCLSINGPCRSVYVFEVIRESIPGVSPQIVGEGDSGGPFHYNSPTEGRRVLGIVSAGLSQVICDGATDPSANNCYSRIWVTPINRIQEALAGTSIIPHAS